MGALPVRRRAYHDWPSSTPMLDLARTLIAVASVVIGGYGVVFMAYAVRDANWPVVTRYGVILLVVALANGLVDLLRWWRRHHA